MLLNKPPSDNSILFKLKNLKSTTPVYWKQLREAILTSLKNIQAETLQKLTRLMDERVVKLPSNQSSDVKM